MLKVSILEIFLRGIPEAFLLIFASCLFAHKKIYKKSLFISSVLFSISAYLIRRLPIYFGVHTIIIMIIYILISILINRISINKAISSILSGMILLLVCEWINLFVLSNCLKVNVKVVANNPLMKSLYFMPSLILFICITLAVYVLIHKIKKEDSENVFN